MSARGARLLAWSLFAVFVASVLATTAVVVLSSGNPSEILVAIGVGYALVGALVASRRPTNAVGWLLLATAVSFGLDTFVNVYVAAPERPGRAFVGWLGIWLGSLWIYLPVLILPLVFPTGRLLSRSWRKVTWCAGIAVAAGIVGSAFAPGVLESGSGPPIDNPLGIEGPVGSVIGLADEVGTGLGVIALVFAGLSLILRLRRSRGREQQQVKWFVYVAMLAVIPLVILAIVSLFATEPFPLWLDVLALTAWWSLVALVLVGVPTAIGTAILQHRLYDIDVVINRTLVYGVLTLTLGAAYLGSILLLQVVLSPLTQESGLAIAASTLAVAALFRPLRARIQAIVDRRFFRRRYNAAQTVDRFGTHLRDKIDLDALGSDLQTVVRDTMQPTHVSLWLRSSR